LHHLSEEQQRRSKSTDARHQCFGSARRSTAEQVDPSAAFVHAAGIQMLLMNSLEPTARQQTCHRSPFFSPSPGTEAAKVQELLAKRQNKEE